MKLSDIESKQLLPRFASDMSWLMNAFDNIIKPICERVKSIDAPLTLEAIQACTDEELEALYDQYGVAQYYPNLSRETRDLMLFEMCKIYRYLGTPKAIEILCKYIFDNNPIVVKVLDNLAFDDDGELVDESLLGVFDVNVESQSAFLDEHANARILANIIRFSRNSQFLRYIYYDFPGDFNLSISPINGNIVASYYENDAICEPVELNHYTFIVADATTGQIISGFSNELVYGEIEGIVLQSPRLVYGVDITVPTAQFWFTENGRNETESTVLQPNSTVTVYDESGDTITDEDTIGMYDTASVLAYMQSDGDMISKQDDVLIDNDGELGLQVDSGPISAWSVFAERVFTLSFANTQLPGITITMPADETGHKGTSITLPTMSGEYESSGKTWTPSEWDIGAFGDSYTLNADTVAHLIFEEVQQYQEITLYFSSSSNFAMQGQITSGFTGNVNSAYIYQLYTDAEHTTPWNGYDYSNDYEIGYYSSGSWVKRPSVQEMPDSTSAENSIISWILLDTGYVWGVSNIDTASRTLTFGNGSIIVRIYPKGQQWIPVFPYNSSSGEYDNLSTNRKATFVRMGSHATVFGTFPAIAESFGYKSGMIKSASIQAELQISEATLYLNVTGNPKFSNIVVRFENDICTGYVRSDKADLPTAPSYDGATYTLKDNNGSDIDYDDSFTYKFVLLLNSTGDAVGSGIYSTGAMIKSSTGKLQVRLRYVSSKFNRVWYYRIPIS